MLGGFVPLSTSKTNLGGEAFYHTYEVTTNSFYNRCGIIPTDHRKNLMEMDIYRDH